MNIGINKTLSVALSGMLLFLVAIVPAQSAWCQSLLPPYPGATPLHAAGRQGFIRFRISAEPGRYRYVQETGEKIKVESFTTPAAFDRVFEHLKYISEVKYQVTSKDLDPEVRTFVRSLKPAELTELAQAVGSSLTGTAYRDALLAALDKVPGGTVRHGLTVKQVRDDRLYYFDVHHPYLDFRTLRWIDATRIDVTEVPVAAESFTGIGGRGF